MTPDLFITITKESNPLAVEIYTRGGCFKFFKILQSKFPEAEAFYDGDHVITKIDGKYYDINGVQNPGNHLRMTTEQQDDAESWSPNIKQIISDMLDQTTIDKIAAALKIKPDDFKAKLTSDKEEGIEIPSGTYLTDDDLKTRDRNKYNEAKKAFEEMTVKKIKEEKEYTDFNGTTFEELFQHHDNKLKSKYDSSADDRVKTLESDLEKMKGAHATEKQQLSDQVNDYKSKFEQERIDTKILSAMPKETTIKPEAIVTLFKSNYQLSLDENGNIVVSKNGEVLKDAGTASPLPFDKVFTEYVDAEGYIGKRGGRGGGNDGGGGGGTSTEEDFIEKWEKYNGKKISSQEGVDALVKFQAEQAK
ncbi:MAG TPA: hypothetical protein PK243_10585 [Flexilinea sp.]|nr:hypothetical protein [Flexilinea sp.]